MACVPFFASSRDRATDDSTGTLPRIAREGREHLVCCVRELDRLLAVPYLQGPLLPEGRRRAAGSDAVTVWRAASSFTG